MGRYLQIIILLILLTGCVNLTITQKLHRDGTFDIVIEASSENELIRNSIKQSLEEEFEGASVVETEKGLKITKESLKVSDVAGKENSGIIAKAGFKREFKFPFYYYTITIENEGMGETKDELGMAETMLASMSMSYVIEPFGTIVNTNGVFVNDDKKAVKFNLLKSKNYTVTFRDFFLWSLIGGATSIAEHAPEKAKVELSGINASMSDTEDLDLESLTKDIGQETKVSIEEAVSKPVEEQPQEDLDFTNSVYKPEDVQRVITEAKNVLSDERWEEWLNGLITLNPSYQTHLVIIMTPFAQAKKYVRETMLSLGFVDENKVKDILLSDTVQVIVQAKSDRPFKQRHAGVTQLYVQVGNKKYEGTDLIIDSEELGWENNEQTFQVTVAGKMPNLHEYYGTNTDIVLNLDGEITYYWGDFRRIG